jgi:hypothetical protein
MPAMMVYLLRLGFVIFCALAAVAAWWLNGYLFRHYEMTEGVNLIYWPHGLRVVLTLLFERYAVLGLGIGAYSVVSSIWPDNWIMRWFAPMIGASAAYLAMRMLLPSQGGLPSRIKGLTPAMLIAIGTVSALINSGGHTALRIVSGIEGHHSGEFMSMFVGDLLGALLILYVLKLFLLLAKHYKVVMGSKD